MKFGLCEVMLSTLIVWSKSQESWIKTWNVTWSTTWKILILFPGHNIYWVLHFLRLNSYPIIQCKIQYLNLCHWQIMLNESFAHLLFTDLKSWDYIHIYIYCHLQIYLKLIGSQICRLTWSSHISLSRDYPSVIFPSSTSPQFRLRLPIYLVPTTSDHGAVIAGMMPHARQWFKATTFSSSSSSGRCLSVTAVCVDTHSVCLPTYICVTHPLCTSLCDGPSHTDPRSSILFLIAFRNCQNQVLEYSFRRFHTPHLHYISYCVLFCSSSCYCSCSVLVLWFDLLKIDFLDVPRVRLRSSILLCSTTVLRYTTILPANKQIRPRHRDGFLPRT